METIQLFTLGSSVKLGDLYNYHTDKILPSTCKPRTEKKIAESKLEYYIILADQLDVFWRGVWGNKIHSHSKWVDGTKSNGLQKAIDPADEKEVNVAQVFLFIRIAQRTEILHKDDLDSNLLFQYQLESADGRATHLVEEVVYGSELHCSMKKAIEGEDESSVNDAENNIHQAAREFMNQIYTNPNLISEKLPAELDHIEIKCEIIGDSQESLQQLDSFQKLSDWLRNAISRSGIDDDTKRNPIKMTLRQISDQSEARLWTEKKSYIEFIKNEWDRVIKRKISCNSPKVSQIQNVSDLLEPLWGKILNFDDRSFNKDKTPKNVLRDLESITDLLEDIPKWLITFQTNGDDHVQSLIDRIQELLGEQKENNDENETLTHAEESDSSESQEDSDKPISEKFTREKYSELLDSNVYLLKARENLTSPDFRWFDIGQPKSKSKALDHKVIILMGATGSGKSTLINGMVNYILGVQWADPFRFKCVREDESVSTRNQADSQTRSVTAYTIHHKEGMAIPYSVTIIDTPGYGDTKGVARDKEITDLIHKFLMEKNSRVDCIHAACFVAASGDSRLTITQRYIIDSVLSTFGKDFKENIRLLVTFADNAVPPVVEACRAAHLSLTSPSAGIAYSKFNSSVLYAPNNLNEEDISFDELFWDMGQENFQNFFTMLGGMESKNLKSTREVIQHRLNLEKSLKEIEQELEECLVKIENIDMFVVKMKGHDNKMKSNKDCVVEKTVIRRNIPIKVKTTLKEMEAEFQLNYKEKLKTEKLLAKCLEELSQTKDKVIHLFEKVSSTGRSLDSMALRSNALSPADYLTLMRSRVAEEQKPGYLTRLETLDDLQKSLLFTEPLSPPMGSIERFFSSLMESSVTFRFIVKILLWIIVSIMLVATFFYELLLDIFWLTILIYLELFYCLFSLTDSNNNKAFETVGKSISPNELGHAPLLYEE